MEINEKRCILETAVNNDNLSDIHYDKMKELIIKYDDNNLYKLINSPTYCFKLLFFRDKAMHSILSIILGGFNERVKSIEEKISEQNTNVSNNRSLSQEDLVKRYIALIQN